MIEKKIESYDGTMINIYIDGDGKIPIIFANGLGGTYPVLRNIVNYFKDRCQFISWDYRGLYDSEVPQDLSTLNVEGHSKDLFAIMANLGIEKAILAGWSMGVQVVIECCGINQDKVMGLILINGSYGRPFDTFFNIHLFKHFFPPFFEFCQNKANILECCLKLFVKEPKFPMKLFQKLGLLSKSLDEETFKIVAKDFKRLNLEIFFQIFQELGRHNGEWILDKIEVPTLIIGSERDFFTPISIADYMNKHIKNSQKSIIPRGSHYAPLEYPEYVNLRIEKFLRDFFIKN